MVKTKKPTGKDQQIIELTQDLQRLRADFENYRKRVEAEKQSSREAGEAGVIIKLLPVIDTIDRAVSHIPVDIADHQWVRGVGGLIKQLDGVLSKLQLKRIAASPGVEFNPELHQAIQFDEAEGDREVVAEELQSGYTYKEAPLRHAMVRVTRR